MVTVRARSVPMGLSQERRAKEVARVTSEPRHSVHHITGQPLCPLILCPESGHRLSCHSWAQVELQVALKGRFPAVQLCAPFPAMPRHCRERTLPWAHRFEKRVPTSNKEPQKGLVTPVPNCPEIGSVPRVRLLGHPYTKSLPLSSAKS